LSLKENFFPARKIILAGDDVCFVTEGRIGLEAAKIFIEQLSGKKNEVDKMGYTACAGVALVHQKYPFYKVYRISEMLCSNAKRYLASGGPDGGDAAAGACAIDWHVEFGELAENLEELRKNYTAEDGTRMELRPYLLLAEPEIWEKEKIRRYGNFRKLVLALQNEKIAYARGKLKEFREALKTGENAAEYYLRKNLMEELSLVGYEGIYKEIGMDNLFTGKGLETKIYVDTENGKRRSLFFDAIELIDTFIALD